MSDSLIKHHFNSSKHYYKKHYLHYTPLPTTKTVQHNHLNTLLRHFLFLVSPPLKYVEKCILVDNAVFPFRNICWWQHMAQSSSISKSNAVW